ncbi:MAG: thiamine-phosphate kinase [Sphingobium sp.]|nr:thiamine-phosphate kinase [Sphingobium sp.]
MSDEASFIARMRAIATHSAARGLMDDAAILPRPEGAVVLTHDMLVEGVHFLPDDPAESVAWKLLAVNLSDLAAKGAKPLGVLVGYGLGNMEGLGSDSAWDMGFAAGLGNALAHFDVPLLGGDTVQMPANAPRTLGLTAIGAAPATGSPERNGAQAGDMLFVTGTIGDAGAGLALLTGQEGADLPPAAKEALIAAYRLPQPQMALGQAIAPTVTAMADISDGLLIDAQRIAQASGCTIRLNLDVMPLSSAYIALRGNSSSSRIAAATAGDDYQLLFTAPAEKAETIASLINEQGGTVRAIGQCATATPQSPQLVVEYKGTPVTLPARLGFEHGTAATPK